MNVLNEALLYVSDLMPTQQITITNQVMVNTNGFPVTTEITLDTFAHVQPMSPFELNKIGVSDIGSSSYLRFWIIGNLTEVVNYLNNTNGQITWGTRKFDIYSKADWSLNGWIEVIGTEFTNV